MTIEEAIKELRAPSILAPSGTQFDEDMLQLAEWLEELKELRAKYRNVSEAYMLCNNRCYELTMELNRMKASKE